MAITTKKDNRLAKYSEVFRESCFLIWYRQGRPKGNAMIGIFPQDNLGRSPSMEQIWEWTKKYGWNERADILDVEVAKRIELQAVEERVEMLERMAEQGKALQEKGQEYLDVHGFEKGADALRAIFGGAELERSSRGLSSALIKVSEMDDATLQDTLKKLMNKASPSELEQIVDGKVTVINEGEDTDAPEEPSSTESEQTD